MAAKGSRVAGVQPSARGKTKTAKLVASQHGDGWKLELKSKNGQILMMSFGIYPNRARARRAAESIKEQIGEAVIESE